MEILRLGPDDLDDCLALARSRGWAPDRRKWRLIFQVGEISGLRAPDGALAGCVALTRYGDALAAVGMMLVSERFGRQGLGGRLMEHVLAVAGPATVFLYATALGRPLYERLGFRAIATVTTSAGSFSGPADGGTRPAADGDAAAIRALDARALGGDRTALLDGLLPLADAVRVIERDGAVAGYGAAREGGGQLAIGPLVAPDLDTARALIADLAAPAGGVVRMDIDDRHDGLLAWAQARGLAPADRTWLMVHGDRELPGDPAWSGLPAMLAVG
jgi:predicted N-acetyltransferase YhbS